MLLRRIIQTTAALVAAVVTYTLVTLPAARLPIAAPLPDTVAIGAYHIHTTRSDGAGTPEEVAAAASKAGLSFAILSDHGDATRTPDAPRYVDHVLLIDAVEISAVEGHIVALDLGGAAPYRLGGEARDVIEDVHRLGGIAIVAHPDSPRTDLQWRPQRGANGDLAGADGLEWLNADSEWRARPVSAVVNSILHMPLRPGEAFVALLARPTATLRRWDSLTRRRSMIGLSAVDAHGLVAGLYTASFKSFAQAVILDAPFTGDAAADAARVLQAIRAGRAFTAITGVAAPALPAFTASDDAQSVMMGGRLTPSSGPLRIVASIPSAQGARVVIMHNDRAVAEGMGHAEVTGPIEPGAYRMEAWLGSKLIPWIVTNPVYVGSPVSATPRSPVANAAPPTAASNEPVAMPLAFGPEWAVEHGPSSTGTLDSAAGTIAFHWAVGTEQPGLEFAAAARSMGEGAESFDRVEFTASAEAPMRVSVQFRLPGGSDGERWGRSIYLDREPRAFTIRMVDVTPQGFSATRRPVVARIKSILFVIDTLNTAPGSRGIIHLSDVRLARSGDAAASGANRQ